MRRMWPLVGAWLLFATLLLTSAVSGQDDAPAAAAGGGADSFAFQGQLTEGGMPATGVYDFRFRLFDETAVQIGSDVFRNDISVANGLFTVYPDFGAVFNGDNRFLQVSVRPGASTGVYTTLTPNFWLSPVPYARTAYHALGLATPQELTGDGALVLKAILRGGSGITWETLPVMAVWGDAGQDGAGLVGTADSGWGLFAVSRNGTGVAAVGETALTATANTATDAAIQIERGAIRVRGAGKGASTPVFVHVATVANTVGHRTAIDHPLTNGDPGAILIVTPNFNPGGGAGVTNAHPVAVYYSGARWEIYNTDLAAMPNGAAFNVLVVKP